MKEKECSARRNHVMVMLDRKEDVGRIKTSEAGPLIG